MVPEFFIDFFLRERESERRSSDNYFLWEHGIKTLINRGTLNRKLDLSIKGCLGGKKSAKYAIPREINTVEN